VRNDRGGNEKGGSQLQQSVLRGFTSHVPAIQPVLSKNCKAKQGNLKTQFCDLRRQFSESFTATETGDWKVARTCRLESLRYTPNPA
jgi:hypothetical protein